MRWWHLEQVLAVERAVFPDEPWTEQLLWSELGQLDSRHYLVDLDGEAVIGYAGLSDYPEEAWVQTLAVAPSAQGRGLGSRLLRALLVEADRRGQRITRLEVRSDNAPAQRLYERHGFIRTGVRRGYYQPGGVDAVLMTRRG